LPGTVFGGGRGPWRIHRQGFGARIGIKQRHKGLQGHTLFPRGFGCQDPWGGGSTIGENRPWFAAAVYHVY
jgi:hypothetical protein